MHLLVEHSVIVRVVVYACRKEAVSAVFHPRTITCTDLHLIPFTCFVFVEFTGLLPVTYKFLKPCRNTAIKRNLCVLFSIKVV